jgi:sterol desaturase/sphingolipid hydroxylase (fatty acid hydroxylase superfamily)
VEIITASVPFFFALIGLELLVARVRKRPLYRLSDSISDLSCGILSQFAGIGFTLLTIAVYGWTSANLAILPAWPAVPLAWAGAFLLDDLAYYWMHRASHQVHLLWAGHVVHHSSEEFNLTVALRQSSVHGLFVWIFYLPIALLGVPLTMWLVCHAVNLVYQFWIHTRVVGRLGPLEWIFNTPSHHRVHHGINPEYQDKNFGGTLIIWDRLFGSFEPERAEPVYGITKPLASWNPLKANLHVFADIARNLRAARNPADRLRACLGHPRWRPPGSPFPPGAADYQGKFEPPVRPALKQYALVQFVVALGASFALLRAASTLPLAELGAGIFYLVLSLANIGGVLEGRSWAGVSEAVRLVVLAAALLLLLAGGSGPVWLLGGLAFFAVGSLFWLLRLRPLLRDPDPRAIVAM